MRKRKWLTIGPVTSENRRTGILMLRNDQTLDEETEVLRMDSAQREKVAVRFLFSTPYEQQKMIIKLFERVTELEEQVRQLQKKHGESMD